MKKRIIFLSILIGGINLVGILILLGCLIFTVVNNSISESDRYIKGSNWSFSEEEFVTKCIPIYEESIESVLKENNLLLDKIEMTKSYDVYQTIYYSDYIYLEFTWNYEVLNSYSYAVSNINLYIYDVNLEDNIYSNINVTEIENLINSYGNNYCYDFDYINNLISVLHNEAINGEKKNDHYSMSKTYYYDSLVGNLGYNYIISETGTDSSNYFDPINEEDRSFMNLQFKFLLDGELIYL